MAVLSREDRDKMPKREFGQPEKEGFPMNDKVHDRMAISGATRSEHAGNISHSEADRIKEEARAKLHDGNPGDPPADHKAAVAKMHPEHLHKLVQDAHAGKYGPEAQKHAQAAMQSQGAPPDGANDHDADDLQQGPPSRLGARHIFGRPGMNPSPNPDASAPEDNDEDDQGPINARSIFGR